ncbi:cadmium-translocating P-type ATPase [Lactobacillus panisapium]|uniref:copper-translocating P-type ATPase n=2 Tax=Lactobacillaceae TaxID=33958 RepID=UPI001C696B9F|nr:MULTISPECIES: copper-translocating P-type ATPase [Lactobacillus]MCO6532824.1 cadmium-translocating P-type ATPase [Lactobacillus sp.]MCT6820593.1 cadmium-translocating P-type ATPase [Lactobacillus panisapium]MCT6853634.1 cadmium-translocating P-type ATPase [Lactobacillus panisapium]MCX8736221.1 cadmium-translocating P-type ATPase [Lactobacillus sp. B4026]QYN54749.1 cadmium-translocating P-type ATPase [Lactobacillus panisapium]
MNMNDNSHGMNHDSSMHMDHGQQMSMGGGDMMMHGNHMMHMGNLKQKFWISVILSLPILFLAPAMGVHLPFQFSFPGSEWVVVIFATILFVYGGEPFLKGAYYELKSKKPEMMTLISLGITTAYVYSLYAFIQNDLLNSKNHIMDFFWELATLILIMLLGHWIEMTSVMNASSSVNDLAKLLPDKVHVQRDGQTSDVAINEVQKDATIIVKPGESIPLDGIILNGTSDINESLVTGESNDVTRKKDDKVIGGSVNGSNALTIKVTNSANSGFLANVNKLVQSSQMNKSKLQTLADQVSGWLFYAALIIGIIALIVWTSINGIADGLERMVTVLVIACPHALGLAIPLVNAKSTSIGAKNGLLIRNRNVISVSSKINYLLMDKTGTLTEGKFQVRKCDSLNESVSPIEALKLIASIEQDSTHPIAKSILQYAHEKQIELLPLSESKNISGKGVSGVLSGKEYLLVNEKAAREIITNFPTIDVADYTTSYLIQDKTLIGYVAVGDQVKSSASSLIKQIKQLNITPVMLTGDNKKVADSIAKKLGITEVYSELMPEDKQKIVAKLQSEGNKVMMVGDGINDAPSLAKADIGVAIGAGTDVAVDSADVVLVNSEPTDIISFLKLAQNTQKKTVQNLWWGAGYNIIALPLAAGILAPWGIILAPAVGAILMSLSTVIVAINAETLHI